MRKPGPLLEDRVMAGRPFEAFWYRLRFFWIVFPLNQSIHSLELIYLAEILSQRSLLSFVLIQNLAEACISFVWGGLESHRAWTRQNRDLGLESRLWVRAQATSIALGAVLGISALAFAVWDRLHVGVWTVTASYVCASSLRFFIELPIQVWHAGIFARRRIYRPFAITMFSPVVQGATLLLGWHWFHIWAFAFSQLCTVLFRVSLNAYYMSRVMPFRVSARHRNFFQGSWSALFPEGRKQVVEFTLLGLAYAGSRVGLPALVVLATWLIGDSSWYSYSFALYFAAPALRAAGGWSLFFHFDLARLADGPWKRVRDQFVARARAWSLLPSTYAWLWASAWIWFALPDRSIGAIAYLLLLCWVSGLLAWSTLENFTARRALRAFAVTLLSGAFVVFVKFHLLQVSPQWALVLILSYRVVPLVFLETLPRGPASAAVQRGRVTREVLQKLLQRHPTRFSHRIRFEIAPSLKARMNPKEVDQRLAAFLPGTWTKTQDGRYELWLEHNDPRSTPQAVLSSLAGYFSSWECVESRVALGNHYTEGPTRDLVLPEGAWTLAVSEPTALLWENSIPTHERRYVFRSIEEERERVIKVSGWKVFALRDSGEVYALVGVPRKRDSVTF